MRQSGKSGPPTRIKIANLKAWCLTRILAKRQAYYQEIRAPHHTALWASFFVQYGWEKNGRCKYSATPHIQKWTNRNHCIKQTKWTYTESQQQQQQYTNNNHKNIQKYLALILMMSLHESINVVTSMCISIIIKKIGLVLCICHELYASLCAWNARILFIIKFKRLS